MVETRGLLLRRLADKTDPSTRDADLPGAPPGTWPSAGVVHRGEPPQTATVPTQVVERGVAEGWITTEGTRIVTRPGGPASDPWRKNDQLRIPHMFAHHDAMTIAGVRYVVTHQPDKYAADGDDETPVTDEVYATGATRVDHFYGIERA